MLPVSVPSCVHIRVAQSKIILSPGKDQCLVPRFVFFFHFNFDLFTLQVILARGKKFQ